MSGEEPLVSIGLPVFNGEPYVSAALESILAQDYRNLEILVADNASTDGTREIVTDLASRDERIALSTNTENVGAAPNYNLLLERARGRYFKWAAADDLCLPTFVSACVQRLESDPDAVVAFPATVLIDEGGRPTSSLDDRVLDLQQADVALRIDRFLTNRSEWHPVFGVLRTDVARRARGIGSFEMGDVTFLFELAIAGKFARLDDELFLRRYHDERSIIANLSPAARANWFDSSARHRRRLPQVEFAWYLLGATRRAELDPATKARMVRSIMTRWMAPHWRQLGGEVKQLLLRSGLR